MKLDPMILFAVAVGIVLCFLVGGWNGSPFGRDGALEYTHGQP